MDDTYAEKLNVLRAALDETDRALLALFAERMDLCRKVSDLKCEAGKEVYDGEREAALLRRVMEQSAYPEEARSLYQTMLRLSRGLQREGAKNAAADGRKPAASAQYGLLGHPLGHSASPMLHEKLGLKPYALWDIPEEKLGEFLKERAFSGINVTIPYKKTVIPYLDRLDPLAAAIGAVNTVRKEADGSLTGFNTDAAGFARAVRKLGVDIRGKKAIILGTGGAAVMAKAVLLSEGAAEVILVSRKGPVSYADLKAHGDAVLLVNATPVGMQPKEGELLADLDALPGLKGIMDLIYRPLKTKLLLEGEKRSIKTENGLEMLVTQALCSEMIWQGDEAPVPDEAIIRRVTAEMLKMQQNLVLIGMPGSGKTTQARLLAEQMGREAVDIDDALHYALGMTPGAYIRKYEEKAFREEECAVTREIGRRSGIIIACGGGTVLREENRDALRQNGRIIFLERPAEELSGIGRPLSDTAEKRKKLEAERLPVYRAAADAVIRVKKEQKATAEDVRRAFLEN